MVCLISIILLISTLSMSYGQINHNEASGGVKYFRHNQNMGFYFEPRKIFFPITGLPKFRKVVFASVHLGNYANEYSSNPYNDFGSYSIMDSKFKTPRTEDTSSPINIDKDRVTPAYNAKVTVGPTQDDQISKSSQDKSEETKTTEEVTELTEDFTTPTIETTTDQLTTVEDFDELQRMAVPPQVVASLLG